MNKLICSAVLFAIAVFSSPQLATATTEIITISFSKTLTPTSISGAINPVLSNRLINVNATPGNSSISDMAGAISGSLVNWNARGIQNVTPLASSNLLEGYLSTSGTVGAGNSVWFTGLAANSKYTIYVYSQSTTNGAKTELNYFSKSSPTGSNQNQLAGILTTNTSTIGYVKNVNYLVITTYSTSAGYLSVNYSAITGYPDAVVNAVQIKTGDPAPVPEPSTVVLLGAGGMLAVVASIKKHKPVTSFSCNR
jgi:hypothetical protein